ncbi:MULTISPECIES: c-type cytochrome [Pseudomonas]|uniref:c-type cytochrome n=1 Tax=Pseudomonas TaxID=286 RepID=UPI000732147E|nr:cytochrome c [Pseudomonas fluorescens]
MSRQRKAKDQGGSEFFSDGKVNQSPPAGTIARGALERAAVLQKRPPMSQALLDRGQERFDIYCSPCHGLAGDGNGTVVARGFPKPPDFTEQRLREAPDRHLVDVMTYGYGQMYSYAARVEPADRWAIVAYIRALQLSRHAEADRLTVHQRHATQAHP